jgi:cysteinyl-tRNA synthetase
MLKLYNTMSRKVEDFRPRKRGVVKIFTCGPSIYRRPHIGNYRTFMYEDLLVKYLEYLGYRVDRAIPLTDIEDKTILEAIKKNKKIEELTRGIEKIFISEARSLAIRLPEKTQRSSECVPCAVSLIKDLLGKGYAYRYGRDIFFDPLKFKDFGKLFRLDKSRWPKKKVRFRRDTYHGNRWNLGDFILWHGYREGDIKWWDTGIGRGRPSWNIQDPSVIIQHLGTEIDINCGGIDNLYRHHDYNIAIIEAHSGGTFANYYMHGAHLVAEGKTMSKSRGNIIYPEDVYSWGRKPHELRFFLFYRHYRKKLNFTREAFSVSCARADAFRTLARKLIRRPKIASGPGFGARGLIREISRQFESGMNDDLNAGAAFDGVYDVMHRLEESAAGMSTTEVRELAGILQKIDSVFGIVF